MILNSQNIPPAADKGEKQPQSMHTSNILGAPAAKTIETEGPVATEVEKPKALQPSSGDAILKIKPLYEPQVEPRGGRLLWFMSFVSFLGLQLNVQLGPISIIIYLLPWMVIILRRLPLILKAVLRDNLMTYMPILAALSAVWSPDPMATFKLSIQYSLTVAIGIAAAHLMPKRDILTSWLTALTLMTIAGIAVSIRTFGFHEGIHGVYGLYGSKNVFAGAAAMQFILAAYLVFYARNSTIDRLVSFFFMVVGLIGIYCGHSAGSSVAVVASLLLAAGLQMMRKSGAVSVISVCVGVAGAIVAFLFIGSNVIFGSALQAVGKDSTLTGRTVIWDTGFREFVQRPLFGIGYQAFWRPGYPPAERLWSMFGITGKNGFHFHNEYVNTAVSFGLIGLMLALYIFVKVGWSSISQRLATRENLDFALHSLFFYFLFLTISEQQFFYQFNVSTMVLAMVWADRRMPVVQQQQRFASVLPG